MPTATFKTLLDAELYLPKRWAQDRAALPPGQHP